MPVALGGTIQDQQALPAELLDTVETAYRAVLRRAPDESGLFTYAKLMHQGDLKLIGLLKLLIGSDEFASSALVRKDQLVAPKTDAYSADADDNIQKWLTTDVRAMTERVRAPAVSFAQFRDAASEAIGDLRSGYTREFADSQLGYLDFHLHRFWEIACVVASILKDAGPLSLLDFGLSVNSYTLRRLFPHARIAVADRPQITANRADFQAVCSVDLHDDGLDNLDLGRAFDLVVFSEVIEHLQVHPCRVIRFLVRCLAPNGLVVLTTPNLFSRNKLTQIARRISPLPPYPLEYTQADAPHFHFREYGMSEMLSMIDSAGGSVRAFWFSDCWDRGNEDAATLISSEELGNMFVVFGRK